MQLQRHHPCPAPTAERVYFLDWLRIAAFAVLVPYHVGMYYVTWGFHVKSPFASDALEPWMTMSSPWRMCVLFIVSGAATSFMLRREARGGFMTRRTSRLLLPLVFGMAVILPPQSYFEVVQKFGYAGGYLDFLRLYFVGYHGFCEGSRCLTLPTWNHLWFLPYLWVYTLLLWGVNALWPQAVDRLASIADRALAGVGLVVWPIAALTLVRYTLRARFPESHALFGDWFAHALYIGMFVSGVVFARAPAMWLRMMGWRWAAFVVAVVCWLTIIGGFDVVTRTASDALGLPVPLLGTLIVAVFQWNALLAAFGFARRHLDFDHPWRRYLTEAVFPIYVLHQTLIIVLSQALLPLGLKPGIEGPLLVAATFALSFAGYELVRRIPALRPWMGLGPVRDQVVKRSAAPIGSGVPS